MMSFSQLPAVKETPFLVQLEKFSALLVLWWLYHFRSKYTYVLSHMITNTNTNTNRPTQHACYVLQISQLIPRFWFVFSQKQPNILQTGWVFFWNLTTNNNIALITLKFHEICFFGLNCVILRTCQMFKVYSKIKHNELKSNLNWHTIFYSPAFG